MDSKQASKNTLLWLLIGVSLFMAAPAYAVVGNVTVLSGGEPVAEATVVFQTPDGQVVAEDETDDDGKAAIFIPDSHKGKTLTVVVKKKDQTARRNVAITRDSVAVVMRLTGVAVVRDGFGYAVTVTGLYKWAQFDGTHTYSSSSTSGSLNSSGPGVGVDLNVQPPPDFLGGLPLSFILGFGLPTNLDETGVRAQYHSYFGDTFLNVEENWYFRLLLAYQIWARQQCQLALLGGVQFTDVDVLFSTDQGSSGGVNTYTESDLLIDPVFGLGLSCPLNNTNVLLVANWYLTWMGDVSGSGSNSSFNYNFNVDGGVQSELQFGVRIPLN